MIENLIFETIVGSKAYGTYIEGVSDIDKKGIYVQSIDDILSMNYIDQINVTKDESYWEVQKFLELCSVGNPTALELLFSENEMILLTTPQFELIRENRDKFVTKKCAKAFSSYGYSQISKATGLDKKLNWEKKRTEFKLPMDFIYYYNNGKSFPITEYLPSNGLKQERCGLVRLDHMKDCYALYYDYDNKGYRGLVGERSNEIRLTSIPKGEIPLMMVYYNVEAYSKYMKDYKSYQDWLKNRNEDRYVDNVNHSQKIDSKNMLHCNRLISIALEIATTGTFTVKRPNADYLLSIKRGEVPLDKIIEDAERDIAGLQELYDKSNLPESVDPAFVKELLLKIRKMPIDDINPILDNMSTKSLPFDSNKIVDEILNEEIEKTSVTKVKTGTEEFHDTMQEIYKEIAEDEENENKPKI